MKFANLHLHSTYSDANLSPMQLVRMGKALGYQALALTDHETDAGVKEFMYHAQRNGIQAITGAEFYAREDGKVIHLTALDYDMDEPGIRAFIKFHTEEQNEYTRKCFQLGVERGLVEGITWDDVVALNPTDAWLNFDSIVYAMRLKKVVPMDYSFTDLRVGTFKTPEGISWRPTRPDAKGVIEVVRKAGGVVAFAHPIGLTHLVPKLVEYGLNGIETEHSELDAESKALAIEAAKTYNLYHCGGTDHTGPMSGNGGKYATPVFDGITEEQFVTLKERRLG